MNAPRLALLVTLAIAAAAALVVCDVTAGTLDRDAARNTNVVLVPSARSAAGDTAQAPSPRTVLEEAVRERLVAGAVAAVFREGRLERLDAVGLQDLESRTPMTERSIFRIYSMSKPIVAVAAMMLHDEGRFALGDPVSKYLPEFAGVFVRPQPGATPRPPSRLVTVEDLLLHTSGLSHRTSAVYRDAGVRSRALPLPRVVENMARAPLLDDPGTRFRYSEGTTVVGRLIEIWSGHPLDVFLSERIFTPLGMTDTGFWVRPDQRDRLATVYGPGPDEGLVPLELEDVPFTERPTLLEGAVGLVSTVPDYLRFSRMLLDRGELEGVRILRADTVDRITRNGLPPDVLRIRSGGMGWALANVDVALASGGSSSDAGEFGWDGTAGTVFWINPMTRTIAILMTQRSPYNPGRLHQRFKASITP